MKRSLLVRLRTNGAMYICGALILLLGIPLYQIFVLGPTGFSAASESTSAGRYLNYLSWIGSHELPFLFYRFLLIIAMLLLCTLAYSLYRIIVAQELMAQQEGSEETDYINIEDEQDQEEDLEEPSDKAENAMPEYAWRGKGFAIIAVWLGIIGFSIYLLSTLLSSIYLAVVAQGTDVATISTVAHLFTIGSNTIGIGAIGLSILFTGAMIARTGGNLWPRSWVLAGYSSIFVGALLSISAVAVASTPGDGQSNLTTIAVLLFALWALWIGAMLVRLQAE